ncbi:endolytic transglycosylase MltG [Streptomyces ipomoeae]|uniref:Endolytic murein transglycosylase n=1 Tax=Streptomyces ipomoeae TaxID=103232 RepID=A0AAE8W2G3_9ACTN|nr:endolytic transglycosylase MltG [Streptomyces ipomoeae]MDX2694684.1 endolytic transglycosylase MltG [Streptomyces ipomoeae]MDX2840715.1 endolytic transglycosylase MltG [Streptomyces ipomoeae]TQE34067.1 endolytic transglycosylase MltG [Streptomyces ipomoeae]
MTEYGRGPGSEPWDPDDPLYGDGGWGGQQAQTGGQSPYGGQPQQHYPEQHHQQSYQQANGGWGNGQQDVYAHQQYQQEYGDPGQQHYPGPYQQQYGGHDQQYDQVNGGWSNGTHQHAAQSPYVADPANPYGGQQAVAYDGGQSDFYGTPDAYPPPEPPTRRHTGPEPGAVPEAELQQTAERTDWDPGPEQDEHPFFAGGADDDGDGGDDEAEGRGGRGERKGRGGKAGKPGKSGKKSRNGVACLVVVLVIGGGIGGAGYFGYQFYQSRFGEAPDYSGSGTNETVTVTISKGDFGSVIGQKLKAAGVVKSVDAFTAAQAQNPDAKPIQAGVYLLKKEMSAESALALMLDPKSQSNFTVVEGERNNAVYAKIDKKLGLEKGTTENVAEKEWSTLGLPDWANDNDDIKDPLEGFLYPSTYPVAKGMKPKDVLKEMVDLSNTKYEELDLEGKAEELKLDNPLQVLTVASLVQAEGKTNDDFRKMAEVIYNRLKPTNTETYQLLQFDSTFNYLKGESNIDISESEVNSNQDPYNTYTQKGLPPGPIDNPGADALQAALNPTDDGWIYFVATDGVNKTEFAKTHNEFLKLKEKFNASSGN